jgi:hypothetical protein
MSRGVYMVVVVVVVVERQIQYNMYVVQVSGVVHL